MNHHTPDYNTDPHPVWGFLKLLAGALVAFVVFWFFVIVVFAF